MKNKIKYLIIVLAIMVVVTSCGYTNEDKKHMAELESQAQKNALNYIKEKYNFDAKINSVKLEYPKAGVVPNFFPPPTGFAIVSLEYQNKNFEVYITGEEASIDGKDNYEMTEIINDTIEYINNTTGLKPHRYAIYYGNYNDINKHNGLISEIYNPQELEKIILNNNFNIVLEYINEKDLEYIKDQQLLSNFKDTRLLLINYNSIDSYNNALNINDEPISTYNEGYVYENAINIQSAYGLSKFKEKYYHFNFKKIGNMQYTYINDSDNDVTIEETSDINVERWIGKGACQDVKKLYKDFQISGPSNPNGEIRLYIPIKDIKETSQNSNITVAVECGDKLTTNSVHKNGDYYIANITFYTCDSPDIRFTFMTSECSNS